jgi:hypothetical protein
MAAQGPQMTLGGATRGDAVEAKGLAESRDGLGHGHALGLLLLSRLSKRPTVPDGLVKEPSQTLQTAGQHSSDARRRMETKTKSQSGRNNLQPGHAAVRP